MVVPCFPLASDPRTGRPAGHWHARSNCCSDLNTQRRLPSLASGTSMFPTGSGLILARVA
jgi:hypothetical protein